MRNKCLSFSITAHIIVTIVQPLQLIQNFKSKGTVYKIFNSSSNIQKKYIYINLFVRKFLIKTILTNLDLMQNFDLTKSSKTDS